MQATIGTVLVRESSLRSTPRRSNTFPTESPAASSPFVKPNLSVPSISFPPTSVSQPPQPHPLSGEDSYWASYGVIQGTADSTIPSPRIDTKDPPQIDEYGRPILHVVDPDQAEHVGPTSQEESDERVLALQEVYAPQHQRALSLALQQISPRPPPIDEIQDVDEILDSPTTSLPVLSTAESAYTDASSPTSDSFDSDAVVKSSLRGLYLLWLNAGPPGTVRTSEQFISLVQDVVQTN